MHGTEPPLNAARRGAPKPVLENHDRSRRSSRLLGHPEASRHVTNLNLRGTIKELAQLDGGFVVSHDGVVLSACRYLDAVAAEVDVPLGLGSRHIAVANMSAVTEAVGIVVSESSVVRLFCHGQLVGEIIPELWMMDHTPHLRGTVKREQVGELTVLTPSTPSFLSRKGTP